jgi:hypothetical protein
MEDTFKLIMSKLIFRIQAIDSNSVRLTPFFFIHMSKVRPLTVPTLKNWTSLWLFNFCGALVIFGRGGEEGTRASI